MGGCNYTGKIEAFCWVAYPVHLAYIAHKTQSKIVSDASMRSFFDEQQSHRKTGGFVLLEEATKDL